MLDFSFGELAFVVLVALLVVGPKDLPAVMHKLGRWVGQFKGITDEFRQGFRSVMNDSTFGEAHKDVQVIHKELHAVHEEISYIRDEQGNLQRVYDITDFLEEHERVKVREASEKKLPEPISNA